MSSDDDLRHELIEASRRRAIFDRARLTHVSSIDLPVWAMAAGALAAWGIVRRRPILCCVALAVMGGAWLAVHSKKGNGTAERNEPETAGEAMLAQVDEASRESFPASDAPAANRLRTG